MKSQEPKKISEKLSNWFIYCDFITYQKFGDAYVPLLRTVGVLGKHGKVVK